ncbi:MAG: HEAT repeat domain-containing protein [Anaerolineales bacterium]|nr:HEAT repeat domain-containing protein [Anaerolineales bacterium]
MRLPRLPEIDAFSFWLGFLAAAALAYGLYRIRHVLSDYRRNFGRRLRGLREFFIAGLERAVRQDVLRYAQSAHLAGTLFPLDEILLPPRLLLPEPAFDPNAPPQDLDLTSVIPMLPEWPELAGLYRAPSLAPAEALAGGSHLLVLGAPGAGKTTLLAHMASVAAREDTALLPAYHTPIFIHAGDLALPLGAGHTALDPLLAAANARASALTGSRLPGHLRGRLRDDKCLILLDGLDELPPPIIVEAAAWLRQFMEAYPQHRVVAAAGAQHFAPLLALPFAPVFIAPWSDNDHRALIGRWGAAWEKLIRSRKRRGSNAADTDPHLIMGWLSTANQGRSIFEITLKIWAAFAGDARGKRPVDWLEAYVLRHGVKAVGQRGLARLATALLERELSDGLTRAEATALLTPIFAGPGGSAALEPADFLDDLVARRLLARYRDRVQFQHSLAAAFCAATSFADEPQAAAAAQRTPTPGWVRALYFFAALGELTPIVAHALSQHPDLLHTDLLACARWLRDAPAQARWRTEVFRRLTRLFIDGQQPEALRATTLAAFVAAGDPTVSALFKQNLNSLDPVVRRLSALGLGALGEVAAILPIASHFTDPALEVRWAATLALSVLNHPSALEALAQGLLVGDENLRRACAEALAANAEEGFPVLKEAVVHADLSVRRAGVYGLAATREDWAFALLNDLQHNEQQWFVRSAAADVLARHNDPAARAPRPIELPEAQGWLIGWAATQGLGVPPGPGALDVLNRAAAQGDEATQRAAAGALGRLGNPAATRELYPLLQNNSLAVRDAAFRALAFIGAAAGQRLSPPLN